MWSCLHYGRRTKRDHPMTASIPVAVERRLFEVLGGWVPSVPEPEAKLLLRSHSFQHAWHAELWESLDGAAQGRATTRDRDFSRVGSLVEGLPGVGPVTADRLRAVYQDVVPALLAAYQQLLGEASALTEGALVRAVGLMVADDEAAVAAGRRLLAGISGMRDAPEDVRME